MISLMVYLWATVEFSSSRINQLNVKRFVSSPDQSLRQQSFSVFHAGLDRQRRHGDQQPTKVKNPVRLQQRSSEPEVEEQQVQNNLFY